MTVRMNVFSPFLCFNWAGVFLSMFVDEFVELCSGDRVRDFGGGCSGGQEEGGNTGEDLY